MREKKLEDVNRLAMFCNCGCGMNISFERHSGTVHECSVGNDAIKLGLWKRIKIAIGLVFGCKISIHGLIVDLKELNLKLDEYLNDKKVAEGKGILGLVVGGVVEDKFDTSGDMSFESLHIESIRGRGLMFLIENPIDCVDFDWVVGKDIKVDGNWYKVNSVERFALAKSFVKGEHIGLLVVKSDKENFV